MSPLATKKKHYEKYTYILLMILGVMMAQCTPEDLATPDNNVLPEEKEEDEYTNS